MSGVPAVHLVRTMNGDVEIQHLDFTHRGRRLSANRLNPENHIGQLTLYIFQCCPSYVILAGRRRYTACGGSDDKSFCVPLCSVRSEIPFGRKGRAVSYEIMLSEDQGCRAKNCDYLLCGEVGGSVGPCLERLKGNSVKFGGAIEAGDVEQLSNGADISASDISICRRFRQKKALCSRVCQGGCITGIILDTNAKSDEMWATCRWYQSRLVRWHRQFSGGDVAVSPHCPSRSRYYCEEQQGEQKVQHYDTTRPKNVE